MALVGGWRVSYSTAYDTRTHAHRTHAQTHSRYSLCLTMTLSIHIAFSTKMKMLVYCCVSTTDAAFIDVAYTLHKWQNGSFDTRYPCTNIHVHCTFIVSRFIYLFSLLSFFIYSSEHSITIFFSSLYSLKASFIVMMMIIHNNKMNGLDLIYFSLPEFSILFVFRIFSHISIFVSIVFYCVKMTLLLMF